MATASIPSIYLWLVIIFPFVGALLTPLLSKLGGKVRDYAAVAFSALSALFAFLLLIPVLQGESISVYNSVIPTSVPWISELGINMGVLYDPFTIIIVNVVTSIALLIMVYSLDYMRGEHGLTRYWFFMNFFLGNMLLIVLSDNLLALFIGWEGVGLCSYALIGFHYHDEPENWVGTPGQKVLGEDQAYSPSHAGMKALIMTRVGDMAMLSRASSWSLSTRTPSTFRPSRAATRGRPPSPRKASSYPRRSSSSAARSASRPSSRSKSGSPTPCQAPLLSPPSSTRRRWSTRGSCLWRGSDRSSTSRCRPTPGSSNPSS